MAWTTPVTVAPGDAILSSLWNEQVRDNSDFLYAPPMCVMSFTGLAHNNVNQVLNPTFTESVDNDSMHTTGANNARITINTAGVYLVVGFTKQTAGSATVQDLIIRVDGTTGIGEMRTSTPTNGIIATCVHKAVVGTYFELVGNNNNTATLDGRFSVTWIGNA